MTRMLRFSAAGIILTLGCTSTTPAELTDADRDAIREYYAELARVLSPEDNRAWADRFTEDAIFMAQDQPWIRGREALYAWGEGESSGVALSATFSDIEIHGSGDWAWVTLRQVLTLEGVEAPVRGKALAVFQRQPDGTWLTAAASVSNDQPSPGS
jgi:ketosteroid isomerase-like protein